MGKSSAEIDRGPPQGAAEVSAKLPPAALESTLHVSCMYRITLKIIFAKPAPVEQKFSGSVLSVVNF